MSRRSFFDIYLEATGEAEGQNATANDNDADNDSDEVVVVEAEKSELLKKTATEGGKLLKKAAQSETTKKATKWLLKFTRDQTGKLGKKGLEQLKKFAAKGAKLASVSGNVAVQMVRIINYFIASGMTEDQVRTYASRMWAAVTGNRPSRISQLPLLRQSLAENFNLANVLEEQEVNGMLEMDDELIGEAAEPTERGKLATKARDVTKVIFNKLLTKASNAEKPTDPLVVRAFQNMLDAVEATGTYNNFGWIVASIVQEYYSSKNKEIPDKLVSIWLSTPAASVQQLCVADSYFEVFQEVDTGYAYTDQPIMLRNVHASMQYVAEQHGRIVISHPLRMTPLIHKNVANSLHQPDVTSPFSCIGKFDANTIDRIAAEVIEESMKGINADGQRFIEEMQTEKFCMDLTPMDPARFFMPTGLHLCK